MPERGKVPDHLRQKVGLERKSELERQRKPFNVRSACRSGQGHVTGTIRGENFDSKLARRHSFDSGSTLAVSLEPAKLRDELRPLGSEHPCLVLRRDPRTPTVTLARHPQLEDDEHGPVDILFGPGEVLDEVFIGRMLVDRVDRESCR